MKLYFACAAAALLIAACAHHSSEAPDAAPPVAAASAPTAQAQAPKAAPAAAPAVDAALAAAIANPARAETNKVRDAHRHPTETLAFFGVKPGMTVAEYSPGAGYYAEILSPYLAASNGKYIATGNPIKALEDSAKWGTPTYVTWNKDAPMLAPAGTVDLVLTFRNIHNLMWQPGQLDKFMTDSAAALKPGGVLGVVEHRADPRPETVIDGRAGGDGYVSKATIVEAAKKAGLVLDSESEINANAKDTKDHPFGVWTLPPNSWTSPRNRGETPAGFDAAKYKAIGESDRHTLRFRKPA